MKTPALVAALALIASPAVAQASEGVSVADTRAWLIGAGAQVAEPVVDSDGTRLDVTDGPLSWSLRFPGCQTAVCGDAQFAARFTAPGATLEAVNDWNADQRFLKAFAADGSATVQYDLVLNAGTPQDQLSAPALVWIEGVRNFAVQIGYARAE